MSRRRARASRTPRRSRASARPAQSSPPTCRSCVLPAPKALFWNGKTYLALDNANLGYPHGDYGYYGVRINSQGLPLDGPPGGSPESSGPLLPGYYSDFGVQPLCDATGCYAAGTWAPAIGTLQLFVWRVTDANGTFDRSDPSLVAEMAAMRRGSSAVALPGSVGRLLYTRVATEPELLGVSRVFLRTAQPPRTRAVHH